MKKLLKTSLFIIFTVAFFFAIGLLSYAEDDSAEPVWRVTHADGTTEELNDFLAPFDTAMSGDSFELLPEYLEVDIAGTHIATANADYTLDFGSSTLVLTNKEIKASAIAINNSSSISILGDGCTVYLQDQTSSFMTFNSTSRLYLDGGRNMFRILAPDSFEILGNATAEVHNLYVYKHCSNMMGGFCVRSNATATIYNSLFYSENGRSAVFSDDNGSLKLINCDVISLDNTSVMALRENGAKISFEGDCYVYGSISFLNSASATNVELNGCLFTNSTSFNSSLSNMGMASLNIERCYSIASFVAPNSSIKGASSFLFTRRFSMDNTASMDLPVERRVWELTDSEGELLGYLNSFEALVQNVDKIGAARLLKDIEVSNSLNLTVSEDMLIDLSSREISIYPHPYLLNSNNSLFTFLGEGTVEIRAFASVISGSKGSLAVAKDWASIYLNMSESIVCLPSLAHSFRGDLQVEGLVALGEGATMLSTDSGSISIASSTLRAKNAPVVHGGSVEVRESTLISTEGVVITTSGELLLEDCPAIIGDVVATRVTSTAGTLLTKRIARGDNFFHKKSASSIRIKDYALNNGGVESLGEVAYYTTLVTVPTEGHLSANLTLATYPRLNVYLPMLIAEEDREFALRISSRGVLYNGGINDAEIVTVNGERCMRFSYPYVYSDGFDEEVTVELAIGKVTEGASLVPYKLALDSLDQTDDEFTISATIAYLNYALYTCYDEDIETIVRDYSSYLPTDPEYAISSRIKNILSSISLDTESNLLYLNLADRSASLTVNYTYGGRKYTAIAEQGRVELHWHRMDITRIELVNDGESITINLAELYSLVSRSPSRSSKTLARYIAFINLINK